MTATEDLLKDLRISAINIRCVRPNGTGNGKYASLEEFILGSGEPFESNMLTREERDIIREASRGLDLPIKMCFDNSQRMVLSDKSGLLQYMEGFAIGSVISILHAWVVINGKVVDPTMRLLPEEMELAPPGGLFRRNRSQGWMPAGRAYVGVPFTREEIIARRDDDSDTISLLDNWIADWPVLKREPHFPERLVGIQEEAMAFHEFRKKNLSGCSHG